MTNRIWSQNAVQTRCDRKSCQTNRRFFAHRFAVSRPTVKEALKRLATQNLIRTRRGPAGGSFVSRPSSEEACAGLANTTMLLVSLDAFSLDELSEARRQNL